MAVQEGIFELTRYWAAQGCLVLPPCEAKIPAGTLHPDVFFHLLDGKSWRAAYLQPVRRPLDGRHGRHPYRLARHLQLQVVLQGTGEDVRELYLESLRALGCDLAAHDLRFTEWNWESQALGAWGLGWHVQLDGLGVTRLTFVQQLAGIELQPVAVEISYGLERLLMALARVRSVFQLPWRDGGASYGDLHRPAELEHSRWAVEVAGVEATQRRLEDLAHEARAALEADLPRFAYELAVGVLYSIDLLDARGQLTARERHQRLEGVRELVTAAAERYLGGQRGEAAGPEEKTGEEPGAEPAREQAGEETA